MPLFQAVRRVKAWPVRMPLYDARECPDCGALVVGSRGQEAHLAYHVEAREWQDAVYESVRQLVRNAGMSAAEMEWNGGEADGLDVREDEQHDAKRRRVPWRAIMTAGDDDDE